MPSRARNFVVTLALLVLGLGAAAPAGAQKVVVSETDTLRGGARPPQVEMPSPPIVPPAPEPGRVRVDILSFEGDSGARISVRARERGTRDHDEAEIVRMGEDIVVRAGEVIDGDVVAIGGSVTVYGTVTGDVVAIGGRIRVRDGGFIAKDAVAIGGTVESPGGGRIGGQSVGMRFLPAFVGFGGPELGVGPLFGVLFWSAIVLLTFLVGWLLVAVAGQRVTAMGEYLQERLWKSLFTGLAVLVLSPIAFVLLLVTILGIPLALLLPVAVPLANFVGFLVVSVLVGQRIVARNGEGAVAGANGLAVGILIFFAAPILGQLLGLAGGVLAFLGAVLKVFGAAAALVAATIGLGALVLSRFGRPAQTAPDGSSSGRAGPGRTPPPGGGIPPGGTRVQPGGTPVPPDGSPAPPGGPPAPADVPNPHAATQS